MTAGRSINTSSRDWGTPENYVKAVKDCFGGRIDLDPCSNAYSIVNARVEYKLPEKDGLKESWNYPTIYVNPPYGIDKERRTAIRQWLARCADAHEQHQSEVIALVPVATNTSHWKRYVFGRAATICFLYDTRLKFLIKGKNGGKGAPMSCAAIYWGQNVQQFNQAFLRYGAVVDIRPLKGKRVGTLDDFGQIASMKD